MARVCVRIPVQLVAGAARAGVEQRGHIEEDAAGERVAVDRKPWVGSRSGEIVHALRYLPRLHRSPASMPSERALSPQCTCTPESNDDCENEKQYNDNKSSSAGQRGEPVARGTVALLWLAPPPLPPPKKKGPSIDVSSLRTVQRRRAESLVLGAFHHRQYTVLLCWYWGPT